MRLNIFNMLNVIVLFTGIVSFDTNAIDSSEIQSRCQNITPQQRQMAKAAGYNVDELCSSASQMSNQPSSKSINTESVLPAASQTVNTRKKADKKNSPEAISQELMPFGYDLFNGVPTTFAPVSDIPTTMDYRVGPGDEFKIQLLGKENQSYSLVVGRDGDINFPGLGPISFTGLTFDEAKARIQATVSQQMIGVRAIVSLGELRSIRIFVLGDAANPGSYTVSGLSTITNALMVSGGVNTVGSLRNIQLKRRGKVVSRFDLYDLLLRGDTSNDARLQPGDVIYIPPVGMSVGIKGEVNRPAIYELKNERKLDQLIEIAGGYSANAYPNVSHITRKSRSGFSTIIDVDLAQKSSQKTALQNGDLVEISTVLDELENVVKLTGSFQRPRSVKWTPNLKLSSLINSVHQFSPDADLNIALIIRKKMPLRQISVLHFSPYKLLQNDISQDIQLEPLDEIITFNQYSASSDQLAISQSINQTLNNKINNEIKQELNQEAAKEVSEMDLELLIKKKELVAKKQRQNRRVDILSEYVTKIQQQTSSGGLVKIVDISGNVRFPGVYPLTQDMDVHTLVLLAGGLKEASYLGSAEITRHDLSDRELAKVKHVRLNLSKELTGENRFKIQAKDKLSIYMAPEFEQKMSIVIEGEVRFPGKYEFKRGETLTQVINRAGGFTSIAHLDAAVFTRTDLRQQEAKRLEELQARMRAELAASNLEEMAAGRAGSSNNAEQLLTALSQTQAVGRLVISIDKLIANKIDDIKLKDGDQLIVPSFRQEITVVGEVQHSSSHLYNDAWTLEDYLEKSGGLTGRADDERVYVVKADGSVFLPQQSGWLAHQNDMLNPGDTIVVPLDTDKIKSLTLWTNVSQIIYQLALGAAAVTRL